MTDKTQDYFKCKSALTEGRYGGCDIILSATNIEGITCLDELIVSGVSYKLSLKDEKNDIDKTIIFELKTTQVKERTIMYVNIKTPIIVNNDEYLTVITYNIYKLLKETLYEEYVVNVFVKVLFNLFDCLIHKNELQAYINKMFVGNSTFDPYVIHAITFLVLLSYHDMLTFDRRYDAKYILDSCQIRAGKRLFLNPLSRALADDKIYVKSLHIIPNDSILYYALMDSYKKNKIAIKTIGTDIVINDARYNMNTSSVLSKREVKALARFTNDFVTKPIEFIIKDR